MQQQGNIGASYGSDARRHRQLDDISGVYHKVQWYGEFSLVKILNHCWLLCPCGLNLGQSVWRCVIRLTIKERPKDKGKNVFLLNSAWETICQIVQYTQHKITHEDIFKQLISSSVSRLKNCSTANMSILHFRKTHYYTDVISLFLTVS